MSYLISMHDALHALIPATNSISHPYHMCIYIHNTYIYSYVHMSYLISMRDALHAPISASHQISHPHHMCIYIQNTYIY